MLTKRLIFNEERNVTLDVYIPDISEEMPNMNVKPAVLVLPGGGYGMCSAREAEPVAFEFMAKGYNVISSGNGYLNVLNRNAITMSSAVKAKGSSWN